ncbi:MAG: heat-inducible transcription repressor HrcA [Ruminococcaceae bacterium]|nr:heat-inducible transcription repressor HrcA [Oscillospiraceae bacterium]
MENMGLSERKKQILKAIVETHISGGEPVGSKYIVENKQLACSSATIRNEMSELEELGFLEKPHTSSGRVPSEQGYRFYVDSLLQHYAMTASEVAQINQILKVKMSELDGILEKASKLASNLTNYTGFAVRPKYSSVTVSKFEAIEIDEDNLLLVMITSTGSVKTHRLHVDGGCNRESLGLLTRVLNENLVGLGSEEITLPILVKLENEMGEFAHLINPVIKVIYDTMNEADDGDLRISGLNRLLQYPEFSDAERFGQLLSALESKEDIVNLVSSGKDDVNVIIGSECEYKVMDNSSVIYKPIKKNGRTVGAIGVIGPLRMDYAKVLATIEELGDNISDMLGENPIKQIGDKNAGKQDGTE